MFDRGVAAVREVIPADTGGATVVLSATGEQATALTGQPGQALGQIAAVTTTVDASDSPRAPVYVLLNPGIFESLDDRGAQIVLTHELTHAMTGVTAAALTPWVVEGFADYVALASDRRPVRSSAAQVLAKVRDRGAPARLPTVADFASTRHGLGATYESAWLVFRLLGERAGDRDVVRFYELVRRGDPVEQALRNVFGMEQGELVTLWRSSLERLARSGIR